jgi:ArsR family transcriptional regulator
MLSLLKVLADSTRLRLLRILRQGDYTVQDLTQILDMGQSRISRHLKLMSDAGILQVEKQGTWHYYRLSLENEIFSDIWPSVEARLSELENQESDAVGVLRVMTERRQRSQDFFNRHAREWDNMHVELLKLPDYQVQLLNLIPIGGLLVEVGVGTGSLLSHLAQKGTQVLGLDHSPSMINLAREAVAQQQLTGNVDVRLAEMNHLPCADGSARTVVLNQVLHHAEQPVDVFREVARVLEPGGSLVVADLTRHEQDWTRERLADQWLGFKTEELDKWLADTGMAMKECHKIEAHSGQQSVLLLKAINQKHNPESEIREKHRITEDLLDD